MSNLSSSKAFFYFRTLLQVKFFNQFIQNNISRRPVISRLILIISETCIPHSFLHCDPYSICVFLCSETASTAGCKVVEK